MQNERHLVVEEPDGSVAIAFNEEVPAPPPPPPPRLLEIFQPPQRIIYKFCLLYTSPSPRDRQKSRMPSSA